MLYDTGKKCSQRKFYEILEGEKWKQFDQI